jgi:hypothetical protein
VAELDSVTAAALCRSLERVLALEVRQRVVCHDISATSERWDIEARDVQGALIRRVSHTQTVSEPIAMAGAELRDVRQSVEAELRDLGVTGIGLSLHGRTLPTTRRRRQTLGRELARRVQQHIAEGTPIIADPMAALRRGRHPFEDPLAIALTNVSIFATSVGRPARVLVSGDDRFGYRVPELHEEVFPAIATKRMRHGALTADLTLVVEPVLSDVSRAAIGEARARLGDSHRGFRSVYVGRSKAGRFPLRQLY